MRGDFYPKLTEMDNNEFIYEEEEVDELESFYYDEFAEESDPLFEALNANVKSEIEDEHIGYSSLLAIDELPSEKRLKSFPDCHLLPASRRHRELPNTSNSFNYSQMPNLEYDIRQTLKTKQQIESEINIDSNELFTEIDSSPETDCHPTNRVTKSMFVKLNLISDGVLCSQCNNCFRSQKIFTRHLESCPNEYPPHPLLCPYETCPVRSDCMPSVVQHVRDAHKRNDLQYETITFSNFDEYQRWKDEIEDALGARFIYNSGRKNANGKITRRICSYSKKYIKSDDSKSRFRNRSSKKIGRACTAFYICEERENEGLTVRGCFKHIGHENSIRDCPLTSSIRREIASHLLRGLSENKICNLMKENSDPTDRRYYIQPYEVRNIFRKLERQNEKSVMPEAPEEKKPKRTKELSTSTTFEMVDKEEVPPVVAEEEVAND